MRITRVSAKNFRSLEDFEVNFRNAYSVICGKNNSGKSCILKAVRAVLGTRESPFMRLYRNRSALDWESNVTLWKAGDGADIALEVDVEVKSHKDPALFEYFSRIAKIELGSSATLTLKLTRRKDDKDDGEFKVIVQQKSGPKEADKIGSQEFRKWLHENDYIVFHDSTGMAEPTMFGFSDEMISISSEDVERLTKLNKQYSTLIKKASKSKKEELETMLGHLGEKYSVGIEVPTPKFDQLPFEINLSEIKDTPVSLENWGSGTRNRTKIFSSILRAKQLSSSTDQTKKITPIILIEEPEAFLHPSAQSNFGRVLDSLATDLDVQIICTSHSPFLLSRSSPDSNFLIERNVRRGKKYETVKVKVEDDEELVPFAFALGMDAAELEPWKGVLFDNAKALLIVEGELDKIIIEKISAARGLDLSSVSINPIGGKDKVNDREMIRFISKIGENVAFLLDLDAQSLTTKFKGADVELGVGLFFAGLDHDGKRSIEGLFPDELSSSVYGKYPDVVSKLMSDVTEVRRSAKSELKKKLTEELCSYVDKGGSTPALDQLVKRLSERFRMAQKKVTTD